MNKLLSSDDIKPIVNYNIDDLNVSNDVLHVESVLEETVAKLKESEEVKALLMRRNTQLTEDNRTLYERLLNAEKGRILAEKDAHELEKKLNMFKETTTTEEGVQISDKTKALDSSKSDFSIIPSDDLCDTCGTVKVIACLPADALVLNRSDVRRLDADMSMLKEVLIKKELLYNEAIENNASIQVSLEELHKQIETLKSQLSWKTTVISQKDKELQTFRMETEMMKQKLKEYKHLENKCTSDMSLQFED